MHGYALSQDVMHDQVPIWIDHSYNDDTLEEGKRNLFVYLQSKGLLRGIRRVGKTLDKEKILSRMSFPERCMKSRKSGSRE